ncbi:MAG TPA: NAD(P)-dependent oxidoreductase [Longimicrobium sp.]|nr:NAD(P)-dependent oxidoreductase [Longimicrobium sp.]
MKIVVFGVTGNIGRRVAAEAQRRGHQVVGVVRDPSRVTEEVPGVTLVRGDATDAASVAGIVRGAGAVIGAISPRPGTTGVAPKLADASRALVAGAKEAGLKRLLVVGGAGSLEVAPGVALMDAPGFPEAYKAEATEGRDSLNVFRGGEAEGLDWTYVSPAAEIGPGERTGTYRTTLGQFITDEHGHSRISFEDFAVALLDELEAPKHVGRRFGVAY